MMNCNNQPKCKEPCGDCTQEWPVPAGSERDAALLTIMGLIEEAFNDGFTAPETYNDTVYNMADECWPTLQAYFCEKVRAALQSQQPAGKLVLKRLSDEDISIIRCHCQWDRMSTADTIVSCDKEQLRDFARAIESALAEANGAVMEDAK